MPYNFLSKLFNRSECFKIPSVGTALCEICSKKIVHLLIILVTIRKIDMSNMQYM